jgi:hypothetical protein
VVRRAARPAAPVAEPGYGRENASPGYGSENAGPGYARETYVAGQDYGTEPVYPGETYPAEPGYPVDEDYRDAQGRVPDQRHYQPTEPIDMPQRRRR